jgi:hypothetical protein
VSRLLSRTDSRAARPCRRKCYPVAVPRGGRDLTPWGTAVGTYRRDLTSWGTAVGTCRRGVWRQMYISRNFWFEHLFFENQRKIIKKFQSDLKGFFLLLLHHGLLRALCFSGLHYVSYLKRSCSRYVCLVLPPFLNIWQCWLFTSTLITNTYWTS